MRVDETIAIAALCQATIAKLYKLHEQNLGFRHYRRALIMENKWRAARYGLDGKLIDFGKQTEVPVRDLIGEILEFVGDVVDELGQRGGDRTTSTGSSKRAPAPTASCASSRRPDDLNKVVDYMIEETEQGLFESAEPAMAGEAR